jgi:hypothetical protein
MDIMVASFVTPDKLQLYLDSRYRRFKTELGHVFIKPNLAVSNDTVTLGLKKFLFNADITVDGIFEPGLMRPPGLELVGEETRNGRVSYQDFLLSELNLQE